MSFVPARVSKDRSALIAVGLMLVATLFGALDSLIVKALSGEVHPFVMGFTRAFFGLLVMVPWILRRPEILRSAYRFRHALRAGLKLAALISYFVAFGSAPLADVTAIAFTAPIFVTVGAWMFLGELPRALRVAAVILGFLGVLIVVRPLQDGGVSSGLLFALLGALLTAIIQLILKPMSGRDSTQTLVAWNLILTVPIAAVPALFVWQTPSATAFALLALQGVMGAVAMTCVTRAFALAEASLIVPIDFLRLPIVAGLAFMAFGQTVPLTTWIGGAIIFGSTLMTARSARARRPIPT